jgi:hypothetical protein
MKENPLLKTSSLRQYKSRKTSHSSSSYARQRTKTQGQLVKKVHLVSKRK